MPICTIEIERKQAQEFASRAISAEQMCQPELARMFRILVGCCELKIRTLKEIKTTDFLQVLHQVAERNAGEKKLSKGFIEVPIAGQRKRPA
jgi:hypothetical protein